MKTLDWAEYGFEAERSPPVKTLCRAQRKVEWRVYARNIADVQRAVKLARDAGTTLGMISGGKNWGYGSHLPPRDPAAILDLSRLRKISPLDRVTHSIRIEAGVTQGQLHAFLQSESPEYRFGATGAGLETTLIGNALERGIGYEGERDRVLFGFEVVLADGSLERRPALWSSWARNVPVGLNTDALWPQANLGIVVAARMRLRKRQECEDAIFIRGPFARVLQVCQWAYEEKLAELPFHIGEPGRMGRIGAGLLAELWGREPTPDEVARVFPEQKEHVALGALHGRRSVVGATWREIRALCPPGVSALRLGLRKLDRIERVLRICRSKALADRLRALRPLVELTQGTPSNVGLLCLDPAGRTDPDRAAEGALYLNCVSPMTPMDASAIEATLKSAWRDVALTRITLHGYCLITVATFHFPDVDAPQARAAAQGALRSLRCQGYPPYRIGIDDEFEAGEVARRIKRALDPQGTLAPGRYGL